MLAQSPLLKARALSLANPEYTARFPLFFLVDLEHLGLAGLNSGTVDEIAVKL